MQMWVWLTAYVAGFGLLQVLLYRHFSQRTPTIQSTEGQVDRSGGGPAVVTEATETVPCQHCGAVNEVHPMVRYCRTCAESIR